jgi:hypothetical protein
MACVFAGLGGLWVGGTLGIVLGGLLASSKSRDLDAAYQQLSHAIHEYLEQCAKQRLAHPFSPDQLIVLRRVVAETDSLAGLAFEAVATETADDQVADKRQSHSPLH